MKGSRVLIKMGWTEEVTFEQKTRGSEGVNSVVICDIQGG